MPFGKRELSGQRELSAPAVGIDKLPASASLAAAERIEAFRETMLRILGDASQLALAVSTNGSVPVRGIADELDPEVSPISLRGFGEHFQVVDQECTLYPFYGLISPREPDRVSPAPQFQLLDLVARIRDLNVFCQQAHRDEAVGVALQSPGMPLRIDAILALAAHFVAYFECLGVTHTMTGTHSGKTRTPVDLDRLKAIQQRYRLMASDRMVEPETLDAILPVVDWPVWGVEILRRPETGHALVHGVYFPADLARQMSQKTFYITGASTGTEENADA